MKSLLTLILLVLTTAAVSFAQRGGLINSGELLKQGSALHDSSEYKQALKLYEMISRSDTNYVRAVYEKALTCEADSQFTKAIAYCREGLAIKEHREYEDDFYIVYGSTLSDMQKYDESVRIFDEGLAKYPQVAALYFNKAIALSGQNKIEEAEAAFQKCVLINPYFYSAHYLMANTALQQGKLVPAFLGCVAYLLMSPKGRYASIAINVLNEISRGTDQILEFKNKRTGRPGAEYQIMEDILLSKIALDKQYKPLIPLDDVISRQMQVVLEKLDYDSGSKDFYMQYYLPYFKQLFKNGQFELLVYSAFSNVNLPEIKDYNTKNRKTLDAFLTDAGKYFDVILATRTLKYSNRDTVTQRYVYENGILIGKGVRTNNDKTLTGPWKFYYESGTLKSIGRYSDAGDRIGDWQFYFNDGTLKSVQRYTAGKLNGLQEYYFDNGSLSSKETDLNGQLNGPVTVFYYGGAKRWEGNYKAGKKDGIEKVYFPNGNLQTVYTYVNGETNGPGKEYFKNGILKEEGTYTNGKTEGPYRVYNYAGKVTNEMNFVKDKVEGEWKSYFDNGTLKEKRNYAGQLEEGRHEEYYDNGQVSESYLTKKGKINGEALYYSKAGKLYSTIVYDNDILKSVKYFDSSGKTIFASAMKDNLIDVVSFTPEGVKKRHFTADQKGNITGSDTLFYASGKVNEITQYKDGVLNGPSVVYYPSGKRKSEINMTDGQQDGYYEGFYANGKLQVEGWIKQGQSQGQWLYYNPLGNLVSTSYYVNGQLSGYKEEFDPSGKKVLEQKYDSDLMLSMTQFDDNGNVLAVDFFPKGSGKYTLYFTNGKVRAQSNYVNGELDGPYKSFYFDGSVQSTSYYKAGDLDSTNIIYYYGGSKNAERQFRYGSRVGKHIIYSEDGNITSTSNFENDMLNGQRIWYNSDGSKDYIVGYKDDSAEGIAQKFDIDGSQAYQVMFENDGVTAYSYLDKDGKLLPFISLASANDEFKSFYSNGKPSRTGTYSNGEIHGNTKVYYQSGQLRSDETLEYGLSNGVSKEYYPDGKLMSETPYVYDYLDGLAKEYYKSGILKKETTYVMGNYHGPTKYYDQNGKLTKTLVFSNDNLISVTYEK